MTKLLNDAMTEDYEQGLIYGCSLFTQINGVYWAFCQQVNEKGWFAYPDQNHSLTYGELASYDVSLESLKRVLELEETHR